MLPGLEPMPKPNGPESGCPLNSNGKRLLVELKVLFIPGGMNLIKLFVILMNPKLEAQPRLINFRQGKAPMDVLIWLAMCGSGLTACMKKKGESFAAVRWAVALSNAGVRAATSTTHTPGTTF